MLLQQASQPWASAEATASILQAAKPSARSLQASASSPALQQPRWHATAVANSEQLDTASAAGVNARGKKMESGDVEAGEAKGVQEGSLLWDWHSGSSARKVLLQAEVQPNMAAAPQGGSLTGEPPEEGT
jgi:hypothetical protein